LLSAGAIGALDTMEVEIARSGHGNQQFKGLSGSQVLTPKTDKLRHFMTRASEDNGILF
jgi:hypothetical protein